jgi:hypothetical protein
MFKEHLCSRKDKVYANNNIKRPRIKVWINNGRSAHVNC